MYPYIERCDFHTILKFQEHLDLRAHLHFKSMNESKLAPSQWETSLQSNAVSHWLGANLEPSLQKHPPGQEIPGLQDHSTTGIQDLWSGLPGPKDHTNHRTTGLQDHRTTGPQDYRDRPRRLADTWWPAGDLHLPCPLLTSCVGSPVTYYPPAWG